MRSTANWSGSAANAYTTFTGGVSHGVTGFEAPLHRVANSIRTYAGVLRTAQRRVAGAISTANSAVQANSADARSQVTAAQQTSSEAQDDVRKAGDQAAGEIVGERSAFTEFMEKLEPYAKANDWAHLPLDVLASDMWLDKKLDTWKEDAEKGAKSAKSARSDLDDALQQAFDDEVGSVAHDFDNGAASMEDVESAFAKYDGMAKTATQSADAAVDVAERGLTFAKAAGAASKVMGGLAIAGDVVTIIHPSDTGAMGTVDRVAAGANMAGTATALLAANASVDWIPGVGEVVAAGTGLYLAGDFVYHNVKWVHDTVNAAAGGIAHGVSKAAHWVGSLF